MRGNNNTNARLAALALLTSVDLGVCFVDTEVAAPWTEDTVRQCLFLYLSLLPLNHQLVHELASVYTEAIADIKRSVLRAIEQPVSLSGRPPRSLGATASSPFGLCRFGEWG